MKLLKFSEMKHGECYTNQPLEVLKEQEIDGLKIFLADKINNAITIFKIQDTSYLDRTLIPDGINIEEWRVIYTEIRRDDAECELNCLNCEECCEELEKKEANDKKDVYFRENYVKAIDSVYIMANGYIISSDNKKWVY